MSYEKPKNGASIKVMISLFTGSMLVTGIIVFALLFFILNQEQASVIEQRTDGVREINPPREVSDFTLLAENGEELSLSDLRGSPSLLFFGYTNCPDVCPSTILDVRRVHEILSEAGQEMNYLFIGVDGERDTPERLNIFFGSYGVGEFMRGMQGENATLRRIGVDYSLYFDIHDDEADENGYYTVDHSSNIYLINAERQLQAIFSYGTLPTTIADYVLEKF